MNIKELREKVNLSQRAFGKRLGLSAQSILNYEAGKNVPESIQKLIRYEFAKYLPEEERLTAESGETSGGEINQELKNCLEENSSLRDQIKDLPHLQEQNHLLRRTVELLEDQVKLYKERLEITNGGNGNGKSA